VQVQEWALVWEPVLDLAAAEEVLLLLVSVVALVLVAMSELEQALEQLGLLSVRPWWSGSDYQILAKS
jgi:hypothetical protein